MDMIIGNHYNWKHDPHTKLVYTGRCPRTRIWHQFEKIKERGKVWCEVLDEDLRMLEPSNGGE